MTPSRLWEAWCGFWFDSNRPVNVRLFRRCLGALLLGVYLIRSLDLGLFFSNQGVLHEDMLRDILDVRGRFSLLFLFGGEQALGFLNSLFLVFLAMMALDWMPRLATVGAFLLHISFLHRNPAIAYGVDLVATLFLFLSSFASSREKARAGTLEALAGSLAYRLLQIQVCIIYFYSGADKLKGGHWWRGDALWYALTNDQIARWEFSWLAGFPAAIVGITYATLIWELYFPVTVWVPRLRYPTLLMGAAFHAGIALTMRIPFFSAIMVLSYVLFVDTADLERLKAAAKGLFSQGFRLGLGFSKKV